MHGVKSYFEANARSFDALYREDAALGGSWNRFLRPGVYTRIEQTLSYIRTSNCPSVLDVGCGSGRNALAFLKTGGASQVHGVDFSQPMLDLAYEYAKDAEVENSLSFECHEFLTWDRGNRTWDLVVCLGVMEYFSDIVPLLQKMHGACKKILLFSIRHPSLVRMPVRKLRYRALGCPIYFYTKTEIAAACVQAGFSKLEFHRGGGASYFVAAYKSA